MSLSAVLHTSVLSYTKRVLLLRETNTRENESLSRVCVARTVSVQVSPSSRHHARPLYLDVITYTIPARPARLLLYDMICIMPCVQSVIRRHVQLGACTIHTSTIHRVQYISGRHSNTLLRTTGTGHINRALYRHILTVKVSEKGTKNVLRCGWSSRKKKRSKTENGTQGHVIPILLRFTAVYRITALLYYEAQNQTEVLPVWYHISQQQSSFVRSFSCELLSTGAPQQTPEGRNSGLFHSSRE